MVNQANAPFVNALIAVLHAPLVEVPTPRRQGKELPMSREAYS